MGEPHILKSATDVELPDIGKMLQDRFSELESDGGFYRRIGKSNIIVVISDEDELERHKGAIYSIAENCPSRFFLVFADQDAVDTKATVSVLCFEQSDEAYSCSEFVQLHTPREELARIKSVVLSNSSPGDRTILCLLDRAINSESAEMFLEMSDEVIVDSASFASGIALLSDLSLDGETDVIDLNWLRLSPWREQIRLVFDQGSFAEALTKIDSITIAGGKDTVGSSVFSLAGWLVSRMEMKVNSFGSRGFECETLTGSTLTIQIEPGSQAGLASIRFESQSEDGETYYLEVSRDTVLHTTSNIEPDYHVSRTLESEDENDLLIRYFAVGDSITNYQPALEMGLELRQLWSSFTGAE